MSSFDQIELKRIIKYDPETGKFWRLSNGREIGTLDKSTGYIRIKLGGRATKVYHGHRLAWLYVHGEFPKEIDHKNRVRSDNRMDNLRPANRSTQMANASLRKTSKSGHKGVFFHTSRQRWRAQITVNQKKIYLGSFREKELAAIAYATAATKYFGEYAAY